MVARLAPLVKDEVMVSNVICGRCGTLLDSRDAICRTCGAAVPASVVGPRKSRWMAAGLAALIPGLGRAAPARERDQRERLRESRARRSDAEPGWRPERDRVLPPTRSGTASR